jgi:hypothetical protein
VTWLAVISRCGQTVRDLLKLKPLFVAEVVGAVQHPRGDVTDLRRRGLWRWSGAEGAERCEVVDHGCQTAPVALLADLPEQRAGVGDPGGEPLVQVGLERIEHAGSAGAGGRGHLLHAVRAVELAHGFLGQPEFPHDRLDAFALRFQRLDLLEPGRGTGHQPGTGPAGGMDRLSRRDQIRSSRGRHLGWYLLLTQAPMVGGDGLLDLFGRGCQMVCVRDQQ